MLLKVVFQIVIGVGKKLLKQLFAPRNNKGLLKVFELIWAFLGLLGNGGIGGGGGIWVSGFVHAFFDVLGAFSCILAILKLGSTFSC